MTFELHSDPPSRWAPWWVYVLVIAPANLGKQELLPAGADWWLVAASTALVVAAGIAAVTAVYRTTRGQPW
jgi:hypothetical protein